MLISEFQMITGIYPTAKLYEAIDKAYMDSKLDKHEFCQRYMENRDDMAMRIAYEETLKESQAEIELSRSEADKRKALEVWIAKLEGEVKFLAEKLEREEEWRPYEDEANVRQADYEALKKRCDVLTDEAAKDLIADEYGFSARKVEIRHEVETLRINRHQVVRTVGTIKRLPLYFADDMNYIRFNVCGVAYELYNGGLRLFRHRGFSSARKAERSIKPQRKEKKHMSTQKEAAIWRRLGDIIRRERVANGLTYASVAKRSGVAVRTLMHFEQGENENGGKVGTLMLICEGIGISASDVFAELEGQRRLAVMKAAGAKRWRVVRLLGGREPVIVDNFDIREQAETLLGQLQENANQRDRRMEKPTFELMDGREESDA